MRSTARICVVLGLLLAFAGIPATAAGAQPPPAPAPAAAVTSTLTNDTPDGRQATRFDTDGNAVDAHDGQIAQFGDTYYLYGTSYDCGYQWQFNRTFCGFKVYTSPDLQTWTDAGYVMAPRQCTFCFRPHVMRNETTGTYVMWVNDQDALDNFRVLTSDSPTGPFVEQPEPDLPADTPCTADLGLFVDHDGAGYLTCSNAGWHVAVLRLTAGYLQPTGQFSVVGVTRVEAPALIEQDGTYYLTMSDPNCGYCDGTGTAYVTAPTPLGPWHGNDSWTVADGVLDVRGGLYGLSAAGVDWTDYTFGFDVAPLPTASGTGVQAGWSVRMNRADHGYLFLLSGSGTANGRLTVLERAGGTVTSRIVPLPYPVRPGEWHRVSVTTAGQRVTTSIDGAQVDTFTDATYATGGVGFREWNGANLESARFDNASVVAADGTTLLADDFSSPDLAAWVPPLVGTKISDDSCGGQPAHVTTLRGADGKPLHLYFSDLWNFHTNEALANFHWERLRFAADGSIAPLHCGNEQIELAAGHHAPAPPVPGQDQTSGAAAFSPSCTVRAGQEYGQTFTVGRTGRLTSVEVTAYRDGIEDGRVMRNGPTAPLTARLVTLDAAGVPDRTLWSTSVRPDEVGWSARQLGLRPGVAVRAGQRLGVVLSTTSLQGCYGVPTDPTDPYAGGAALAGAPGSLAPVAGTDLKFRTTVDAAPRPARPDARAATAVLAPDSGDLPVLPGGPTRGVVRIANLTDHAVRVPVTVTASAGFTATAPSQVEIGIGETVPVAVEVGHEPGTTGPGRLTVRAGAGSLTVPLTVTDDLARTAVVGASSTTNGWNPTRVNDGDVRGQHDFAVWNAGGGWNDLDRSVWPDRLTAMWPAPVTVSRVQVRTLDAPSHPASVVGVRDYDVQAWSASGWTTVGSVRGNTVGTIATSFAPVTTTALRLVVLDSNDHGYSRVVALEAYPNR